MLPSVRGADMKASWLGVVGLLVLLGVDCSQEDRWEGYVYPDQGNLLRQVFVGEHTTLEACRVAALTTLHRLHAVTRGDYECGKNCRSEPGFTVRLCETTLE